MTTLTFTAVHASMKRLNLRWLRAASMQGFTVDEVIGGVRCPWRLVQGIALLIALLAGIPCAQAQSVVATLPVNGAGTVAVNETTNMIYVTAAQSPTVSATTNTVTVINGATSAVVTTIQPGGPMLGSLAVNPTTNTIYALDDGWTSTPGSVAVINGTTNAVTTSIALPAYGAHMAVNPATNLVYVCTSTGAGNGAQGALVVIDGSTNTITDTISLPELASQLAVDTTRNLIYLIHITEPGNGTLEVIDGSNNTVKTSVSLGYNDSGFLLDTTTNTIYVPDAHGNQMYIVDGTTDTTTTVPFAVTLEPGGFAINPVTNKVYFSAFANNALALGVFDGSTKAISYVSDPSLGPLLVNSTTNQIWQASSPVFILDGATSGTTTVSGTSGVGNGALNTTTNYAYMTSSSNVYVINGQPAGPAFSPSSNPVAFGNQTQDTTSSARTLTVTNTGTTDLNITTVTAGGTNMADFPVGSDTCSNATVSAGKTCTVSIEFKPSTTSNESATLTFADNASDSPQVVNLTGTGTAPVATASTTALSASATSISVGTSVTFTATVTPASGTPTPTGTVTFKDGTTTLGTGTLNGSGVATYSNSALAIGSHSVTASYGGDSRNLASTSAAVAVTVAHDSTTTTLASSAPSSVVSSSLTFTATVSGPSGAATPTGTVTFTDGSATIGTGTLNGSGVATLATSALAAGSHSITATYGGDANDAGSTSSAVAITVWPGPPDFTLGLSSSSGTFKAGKPATVTITLTSVNGFSAASTLSCGSLPKNSNCDFSQSSITPGGSGTATSTLTIDTNVKATSANAKVDPQGTGTWPTHSGRPLELAGVGGIFLLLLPFFAGPSRRIRRLLLAVCGFVCLALLTTMGISGCGGGPTTPKGNYPVQITATSGSTTHTTTFNLTID